MDDKATAILKAATEVFLQHGFSSATTDMIQRQAGVSKATIYAHYTTKEALFSAVIASRCEIFTQQVKALGTVRADAKPEEMLTEMGTAYLRLLLKGENLAFFRVISAEAPRFPELAREFYLAGPLQLIKVISEQLNYSVQQGYLDLQSIGITAGAETFLSSLRGMAYLECITHHYTPIRSPDRPLGLRRCHNLCTRLWDG